MRLVFKSEKYGRELLRVSRSDLLDRVSYLMKCLVLDTFKQWGGNYEPIDDDITQMKIEKIWTCIPENFKIQQCCTNLPNGESVLEWFSKYGYFWHRLEQHEREQPELSQKKIKYCHAF